MTARWLLACAFSLGVVFEGRASGSTSSVAILLEPPLDRPELAATVEADFIARGARVLPDADLRAAMRRLDVSTPLSDWSARGLREALGVDRLVVVSVRRANAGHAAMARFVDSRTLTRRFAILGEDSFDTDARELIGLIPVTLISAGPVPAVGAPPDPVVEPPSPDSRFGDRRTFEAGVALGFFGSAAEYELPGLNFRSHVTDLYVSPLFGFFLIDRLEVLATFSYRSSLVASSGGGRESFSGFTIGTGIAYLPRVGNVRFGPQLTGSLVAYQRSYPIAEIGVLRFGESGSRGTAGFVAKVPLGPSALLTIDAHLFNERVRLKYYATRAIGSYSGTGFTSGSVVSIGFSYWH